MTDLPVCEPVPRSTAGSDSRLKVLFTVPWGSRFGGAENFLWGFLQRVDRSCFDCIVVFFQAGPFEREVAAAGIRTFLIPTGRLRQPHRFAAATVTLARLIRTERPDIVLNWSGKTHIYGAAAAKLARFSGSLVWFQHGIPWGHWMERIVAFMPADAVLCCSHASARAQARLRLVPRRRIAVSHPIVDPPRLIGPADIIGLRRDLGISPTAVILGIVGRLQPDKGQHLFIEALAVLRRKGFNLHGLIVGGNAYDLAPGYELELRALAESPAIRGAVTFIGQVPSAASYIQLADVVVSASQTEGFSLVVAEAMALGKCVVVAARGGPEEMIETNTSGVLVNERTASRLAAGIEPLLANSQLRRRLGHAARLRYRRLFTPEIQVEQMEMNLRDLATSGRPPPDGKPY